MTQIYEVAYCFRGHYWGTQRDAILRAFVALDELRSRGIDIEHLGGTITLESDGTLSDVTSYYAAPTQGHVGWLTMLARLPVSGIRRVERPISSGVDRERPIFQPEPGPELE